MARDYEDFVDLVDPDSDISKIITSKVFEPKNAASSGSEEQKEEHMDK